jgi:hypothetical protein
MPLSAAIASLAAALSRMGHELSAVREVARCPWPSSVTRDHKHLILRLPQKRALSRGRSTTPDRGIFTT